MTLAIPEELHKIIKKHKEIKWIEPRDIDKYETVPKLKETLERVLQGVQR